MKSIPSQTRRGFVRQAPVLFAALMTLLITGACSKRTEPSKPVNETPTPTPRIVVLSPAVAATARDLGLEPNIVGRHSYDLALDRTLPVCGDQSGIDYETLLGTHPTDILIEWGSRPLPPRLEELGRANNWKIERFSLLTLDDIRESVKRLGQLFPSCAGKAEASLGAMDRAWASEGGGVQRGGKVLILHTASPPSVLGPGSFHHQLLTAMGGTPAIEHGSPYMEMDAEDLIRLAPDCIVIINARAPEAPGRALPVLSPQEATAIFGARLSSGLEAVKTGRVAVLDDPFALLPSTSMVPLADKLRAVLAGWSQPK